MDRGGREDELNLELPDLHAVGVSPFGGRQHRRHPGLCGCLGKTHKPSRERPGAPTYTPGRSHRKGEPWEP
jgi:hypothetical protein